MAIGDRTPFTIFKSIEAFFTKKTLRINEQSLQTEQVNNSQNVACPVGPKTETLVQATLDDWITGYYVCIFNEVRRPLASTPLGAKKVQCFDLILLNHHLMFQFLFSSEFNILCNLSRACSSLN